MNIKPNIGILNALIRITMGLTILAWSTSKMVKRPWRDSYLFVAMCAAMKVAEGVVRYCPVTALIERYQCMMGDREGDGWDTDASNYYDAEDGAEDVTNVNGEQAMPYNPS